MKKYRIVLAGNANVGKSVVFNELTGLEQKIGNWPGKTVERAEGKLVFKGNEFLVLDLPGIYSLSPYSLEERISREYIAIQKPDLVINVVDATVLERNLFFTLQLLELGRPVIVALNQVDRAEREGMEIDPDKLSKILGVPVVPTVAIEGKGIYQLMEMALKVLKGRVRVRLKPMKYAKDLESRIERLEKALRGKKIGYPSRWAAIKLLEGDREITGIVSQVDGKVVKLASRLSKEIEEVHGKPASLVMTCERYAVASRITRSCLRMVPKRRGSFEEVLDSITLHRVLGYPILILVSFTMLYGIFIMGEGFSELFNSYFENARLTFEAILGGGALSELIWGGVVEGIMAGITIAVPYILPFYILLAILEDSGYLSRVAFLMDSIMHKLGLHGKAFIPLLLGYGCNVPACLSCRIMETEDQKLITGFLATLVPCAARTVIILGLVGTYIGFGWAMALYLLNLIIIFILGKFAYKVVKGEGVGMIMEMPPYRMPSLKVVIRQTWIRFKDFVYTAFPLIIIGGFIIKFMDVVGYLPILASFLSPITVQWLGLPEIVGVTLIFGILRKELALILLASFLGTDVFSTVLTPTQMLVYSVVVMFYIPCIATIAVLVREFGWRKAMGITMFEIGFAILLGGIAYRLLPYVL